MSDRNPTPWRAVRCRFRAGYGSDKAEVHDANGDTVLPWTAFDHLKITAAMALARRIARNANLADRRKNMTDDEREFLAGYMDAAARDPAQSGRAETFTSIAAQLRADGERIKALEDGIRFYFEAERQEDGELMGEALTHLYALLKTPPVSGREDE